MSTYGIKVKGFEDPLLGFEDPLLGLEDPSFGYRTGELKNNLTPFVGKKAPATLKQDGDVLQIDAPELARPVRLVPKNRRAAASFYKLFADRTSVTLTVEDGIRRGADSVIVLTKR